MTASGPGGSAAGVCRRWAHAMAAHRCGREVYQTSTMGALLDGVYEGDVTTRELLRHGDFGLGTFNRLDGEMLVLDGVCYQLRGDGVSDLRGSARSPRTTHLMAIIASRHAQIDADGKKLLGVSTGDIPVLPRKSRDMPASTQVVTRQAGSPDSCPANSAARNTIAASKTILSRGI